jgi:hypothetical protein
MEVEKHMNGWECHHCKSKNDHGVKNCKRCNAYYYGKGDEHMDCEKKKYKKVYTSGPISNATSESGSVGQELWVSVANYEKQSVTVKVEVLNWGDPALSAGLPVCTTMGLGVPMNAMAVPVMPAEKVKIPSYQVQHFFVDLLAGGPAIMPEILSYEIRVTVISKDPHAKVVFNAVSYSVEAELLEEDELDLLSEIEEEEEEVEEEKEEVEEEEEEVEEEVEKEEEEEVEAAIAVTASVLSFKDFVLLKTE